ncbi:tRNA pseudouridine(38-40) synthase TruA [Neotamlana laminarinivorans]|uniref:tRNA pseudouridine synthase A n=1 Tax=Neotamlana laminarinivorans TaxID=2883124 RepID=A0A9X1I1P2_9FLAO|nr:tRNA pseudouridine(38-40) synthase TruA [Tamlana laminarinivorans]MCB4800164.1 tRNA pseudouridine(38-40) synthase TruA [Tamlana laminarinivorans]
MRYFLELSYNGTNYHGWQNQPNAITVQEVIEKALSTLLNTKTSIVGAGRTDAGVHAKQMYAHFESDKELPGNLVYKLNSFLPKTIAIQNLFEVKNDAHARFDALSRTYLYRIATKKNVFNYNDAYFFNQDLDLVKMNKASSMLFNYTDFQCFSKTNTDVKTFNCTIMKAEWNKVEDEIHFTVKADRFLRNMVRAIVGTMVNIGVGKIAVNDLESIIESKNRSEAGFSVPAHGLYLTHIEYPEDIKLK